MPFVTIPAADITVQDGPVTLEHAIANATDKGMYAGNLVIDEAAFFDHAFNYPDALDDYLVDALITDAQPYSCSYRIVGVPTPGKLVIEVTQGISDFLAGAFDDDLEDVDTDVLAAAVERFNITGEFSAAGVLSRRTDS